MRKFSICLCVASVPFLLGTTAFAQTTPPKTEPAEETGGYTLKGVTAKPVAPQTNAAPYEISGTSFSGSGLTSEVILTQPVGNAAAYKTDSGIYFYPSAFTGFGVNSNLKMSNTNAVSSNFVNIAPELVSEFKYKGDRYTLFANVNSTSYANSSEDDFINSEIII